MRRKHILLVGGAYVLLMAGLIAAAWAYPGRMARSRAAATPVVELAAAPTLSQIWPPPEDEGAATRTPRATPTLTEYYVQTWTPEPRASGTASVTPQAASALQTAATPAGGDTFGPPVGPSTPSATPPGSGAFATSLPLPGAPASPMARGGSQVTGRVLLDGTPVAPGLALKLQRQPPLPADPALPLPPPVPVADAVTGVGGSYSFAAPADAGATYQVAFAQDWNASYQRDSIATWTWLGNIPAGQGAGVRLPDLEISLLGMRPVDPAFEAVVTATLDAPAVPMGFTWSGYPQATVYWLDVARGAELQPIWQSGLSGVTSAAWPGLTSAGAPAGAGEYWWGVGAQRPIAPYTLTVYSYLTKFVIRSGN